VRPLELGLAKAKRSTFFDAFPRFPMAWFVALLISQTRTVCEPGY
jgi:hypothetical protein